MDDIYHLNQRANLQVFNIDDKPVVLYEDHRVLLFALWHAKRCGLLEQPHTLVTFDLHDDARPPHEDCRARAVPFRDGAGDPREFMSYVEWDLSPNDDDWLLIAMDLNLVGDVVNIGAEVHSNLDQFETTFEDAVGQPHRAWRIGHLWDELAYQGALTDRARGDVLGEFWQALGWHPKELTLAPEARVLLDFDLDCFTLARPGGGRLAWPTDLMWNLFARRNAQHDRVGLQVLRQLLERSPLVTIARESPYCGGTEESQAILEGLDRLLFNDRLLART